MALTLCGHVRTWHSDNAALYTCPPFSLLWWSCLLWDESNVWALKLFWLPWQDRRRCPQASASHGWVIDPQLPQHSKLQLIPRLQRHSNITHPGASPEWFPLCHLPLSFYLSVLFLPLWPGWAWRRWLKKTISDIPKSTTEGQTTETGSTFALVQIWGDCQYSQSSRRDSRVDHERQKMTEAEDVIKHGNCGNRVWTWVKRDQCRAKDGVCLPKWHQGVSRASWRFPFTSNEQATPRN